MSPEVLSITCIFEFFATMTEQCPGHQKICLEANKAIARSRSDPEDGGLLLPMTNPSDWTPTQINHPILMDGVNFKESITFHLVCISECCARVEHVRVMHIYQDIIIDQKEIQRISRETNVEFNSIYFLLKYMSGLLLKNLLYAASYCIGGVQTNSSTTKDVTVEDICESIRRHALQQYHLICVLMNGKTVLEEINLDDRDKITDCMISEWKWIDCPFHPEFTSEFTSSDKLDFSDSKVRQDTRRPVETLIKITRSRKYTISYCAGFKIYPLEWQ